jgi:nucleoside-diphosphate-sugar epimerase
MHVVVGASGGTGSALVTELLSRGLKVRAVNRSGKAEVPAEVEMVAADASDAGLMREVCTGAEAVYNCVNPPFEQWREVFPEVHRSLVAAAAAAGAVLVFADDTWMYGKVDGPMTETLPSRPVSHLGVFRAWLAEMLLGAHARGEVRMVIGRAGELYGPRVESLFGRSLFAQAVRGHRMFWPGKLDLPITPTYINDFARGLATLAGEPSAWGEVWHVPSGSPTTGREFCAEVGAQLDHRLPVTAVSTGKARPLELISSIARHGVEMLYQFEQPFVVDSSKFDTRFGDTATPYPDAVAETIDWYKRSAHLHKHTLLPS